MEGESGFFGGSTGFSGVTGVTGSCGPTCFPADTMVTTPSGNVPIQDIKDGDKVISAV